MQNQISQHIAQTISLVINPLIIPPILFGFLGALGPGVGGGSAVVVTSVVFYFLIPLFYILYLKKKGAIASLEVRIHSNRKGPILKGVVVLFLAVPALYLASSENPALSVLTSTVLAFTGLLIAGITQRFKISIHVSGVAGLFSILSALLLTGWTGVIPPQSLSVGFVEGLLSQLPGGAATLVISFLLIPLVAWARVTAGAHSRMEVWFGAIFGLLVPFSMIFLYSWLFSG